VQTSPPPHGSDEAVPPATPLALTVLGGFHLHHHHHHDGGTAHDVTAALAPKQQETLAYLALHPQGVARDTLCAAVWPDTGGGPAHNRLHATLSRLRAALRTATGGAVGELVAHRGGAYTLDPATVTVDLWQLSDALAAARRGGQAARIAALRRVAALYRGHLADGIDADWARGPRETLRRRVLDALGALAHTLGEADLDGMLDLLERVRTLDPHNEAVYRDIARVQARLGRRDAVPRTLALLATALADVGAHPSPDTIALCEALQRSRPPACVPGTPPG
jgi:DNA-binding SARP family transcriptional activator